MKKKNIMYFDINNIETLEEYYTKKSLSKAAAGVPQTAKEINELIGNITTSVIDELFKGDTVAVYKNGKNLIRVPKRAIININAAEEGSKKKEGFFKKLWRKLRGK